MALHLPSGQQVVDEYDELGQSLSKRQRVTYEASVSSVYTAGHSFSTESFISSNRVLTSAMWPGNAYAYPAEKPIERHNVFMAQNHPNDWFAAAIGHTSNLYTSLPATVRDMCTIPAEHSFQTHFAATSAQRAILHYEHMDMPFIPAPQSAPVMNTTVDQICFGMASRHQLIVSSTMLT
jgi:hypothetical protein